MASLNFDTLILKGTSVSEEQLKALLHTQTKEGHSLQEALEQSSHSTPEEALSELCKHIDVEFMKDIPVGDIPVDIVRNIPINYAKSHQVLPFKIENDRVIVLTSNPLNYKA